MVANMPVGNGPMRCMGERMAQVGYILRSAAIDAAVYMASEAIQQKVYTNLSQWCRHSPLSASGVDRVHLCVNTRSLSQKPSLKTMPVVSTQSACVSIHFD
ncbi:hypothetical protein Taro_005774 [Colocasia esculenta]|uniref:Uncharacterized protein n=1 Tax=Colocasia esculenta TaxID=4460 RepID=A0A843TTD9_COLES|nr:hypothetical protein [Colocasia esculenta]